MKIIGSCFDSPNFLLSGLNTHNTHKMFVCNTGNLHEANFFYYAINSGEIPNINGEIKEIYSKEDIHFLNSLCQREINRRWKMSKENYDD